MRKIHWIPLVLAVFALATLPYLFSVPPLKQLFIWIVERKTHAKIQIEKLRLSWLGPQRMEGVHIQTPQIEGDISELISTVPFWRLAAMGRSMAKIEASGTTRAGEESGSFTIQGAMTSTDAYHFVFSMTQMPTTTIDRFLNMGALAEAAIGTNFDASGEVSFQQGSGSFNLDLSSAKASTSIQADVSPDALTLRKPLMLSLYLTPELSHFATNGKLSIQSVDPAQLRIAPSGFSWPRPYSLSKLQMAQGSLNLGRIQMENPPFLATLAKFLKSGISTQRADLWLTDVDVSVDNGLLTLGRIDALLGQSLHFCAWGQIDLVQDQLRLTFGIPADTLARSLGIRNLSSSYVLQIPVSGTLHSPVFDTGAATAKIAGLIAMGTAEKQGGILGNVAGLVGRIAEEPSPPPKRPFPWER